MKIADLQLERHYIQHPMLHKPKGSETITSFSRDIFWYNRDELERQVEISDRNPNGKSTYEDHRRAVETAIHMLKKDTQHSIAMAIMSHRFFKDYRANTFKGKGSFLEDYTFIVTKVGMLFTAETSRVIPLNATNRLAEFEPETLVQINYITGTVKKINVDTSKVPMSLWVKKFNSGAPESTTYHLTAA